MNIPKSDVPVAFRQLGDSALAQWGLLFSKRDVWNLKNHGTNARLHKFCFANGVSLNLAVVVVRLPCL